MRSYRPKEIRLSGQTPVNQCLCDYCENCDLLICALIAVGLKNIPSNKYKCLDSTFCDLREGQFGTSYTFAAKKCIQRQCTDCGTAKLRSIIDESNSDLLTLKNNSHVTWHRWQVVEGKSGPMKTQVRGTLRAAVNEFLEVIQDLSSHLF